MAFVFHKYDLLVITTNLSLGYYYLIQYNMLLQEFRLKLQNAYLIKNIELDPNDTFWLVI